MLYIDKNSKTPLYEQIYSAIIAEILSGALAAGDPLPATRRLSRELSIGRNTVDKAYQQLAAEGYIQPRTGSGFFVNKLPLELFEQSSFPPSPQYQPEEPPAPARYDFAYGSMDSWVFPYSQWRKSMNHALDQMELSLSLHYPCRQGEPSLRLEIARYLQRNRGVSCSPSQIVITCGQQHSMEIISNMFGPGDWGFAMEEPGYDGIRAIFANHGCRLSAVPVEEDGICIEALSELQATLLYVTPSHQFPTGAVLPVAKRKQLLHWARERDAYLIEDDYDSELRYYTNPIPAMQSLDLYGRTIYTGTFSKSLAPFMRLAYIVFPQPLMERYLNYYHRYNTQVSPLHQLALTDFIREGHYERHINRLRTAYRKKQAALLSAIDQVFGERISVSGGGAGIHLLLDVKSPLSQDQLIERAESVGIRFYSTRVLYMHEENCPRSQLLLGFPTVPEDAFLPIMRDLHRAWGFSEEPSQLLKHATAKCGCRFPPGSAP
ncbi:MAG: PLP-dependent aminotransferase family protein [Firmicutes bacterium]|nr:PLP-dependent aminotransferase family protein [Bacillota bacterium]